MTNFGATLALLGTISIASIVALWSMIGIGALITDLTGYTVGLVDITALGIVSGVLLFIIGTLVVKHHDK